MKGVPDDLRFKSQRLFKKLHPRAKFTRVEDDLLRHLVLTHGENSWDIIVAKMPGRNVRQCKERWVGYLSPSLNTGPFTPEEDRLLMEKYQEFGAKWVKIATFFKGRSDTSVKNRFITLTRKLRNAELEVNPAQTKQVEPPQQSIYSSETRRLFMSEEPETPCREEEDERIQADLWDEIFAANSESNAFDAHDWW